MLKLISENWAMTIWTVTMIGTVVGLITYNVKIVLPNFIRRMDTMENDLNEIKKEKFMTERACDKAREIADENNIVQHKVIAGEIEKVLKCVQKLSKNNNTEKTVHMMFMSAVKEKLDLQFEIPNG